MSCVARLGGRVEGMDAERERLMIQRLKERCEDQARKLITLQDELRKSSQCLDVFTLTTQHFCQKVTHCQSCKCWSAGNLIVMTQRPTMVAGSILNRDDPEFKLKLLCERINLWKWAWLPITTTKSKLLIRLHYVIIRSYDAGWRVTQPLLHVTWGTRQKLIAI